MLLSYLSLLINSQIKDYSLDEDDDLIKDYENFNIHYNTIKERQNRMDDVWNKPINQNKINQREIEDKYFQEKTFLCRRSPQEKDSYSQGAYQLYQIFLSNHKTVHEYLHIHSKETQVLRK